MVVVCLLCGRSNKSQVSLHSFPKNPHLREKWIAACKIDEILIKPSHKICSMHFVEDCFLPMFNKSRALRKSAVPLLLTIDNLTGNEPSVKSPVNDSIIPRVSGYSTKELSAPPELVFSLSSSRPTCDPHNFLSSSIVNDSSEITCNSTVKKSTMCSPEIIPKLSPTDEVASPTKIKDLLTRESESPSLCTPPKNKRLYFHPRYVGDCTEEHFITSRRRKYNLHFLKNQHLLQSKKIKSLQQKNRNLRKQVKLLQTMLKKTTTKKL